MAELFILALLGHLVGDYLLQTKQMALMKSKADAKGFLMCSLHVLIYTIVVCLFLQTTDPLVWVLVFVPHWIIDRWSLANVWLSLIKGRTFKSAIAGTGIKKDFDIAFTSIVYTVSDNTIHLLTLFLVIKYFII